MILHSRWISMQTHPTSSTQFTSSTTDVGERRMVHRDLIRRRQRTKRWAYTCWWCRMASSAKQIRDFGENLIFLGCIICQISKMWLTLTSPGIPPCDPLRTKLVKTFRDKLRLRFNILLICRIFPMWINSVENWFFKTLPNLRCGG